MDQLTLKLNSPITEEQFDAITDVDFQKTERVYFSTKHGAVVEFVKVKVPRTNADRIRAMTDEELAEYLDINYPLYYTDWLNWLKQEIESNE